MNIIFYEFLNFDFRFCVCACDISLSQFNTQNALILGVAAKIETIWLEITFNCFSHFAWKVLALIFM